MGVDHGLGGKDNKKSQQKREKRAKKQKVIALRALTGGKKKEVIFDEKARTEWLTGFSKRKQERRKYGLAMEVLKKQKEHKEFVKEQRSSVRDARGTVTKATNESDAEDDSDEEDASDNEVKEADDEEVQIYADPSTVSMFGSSVSVVIGTGFEEPEDKPIPKPVANSKKKQEPTRMEKALKKAKSLMGKKKKHVDNSVEGRRRSKELRDKVESSKLLNRVTGAYKGNKKKGRKH